MTLNTRLEQLLAYFNRGVLDVPDGLLDRNAVLMLNGVPYLEKPPLLPWLVTAVYAVAGQSEAASRSVPVKVPLRSRSSPNWLVNWPGGAAEPLNSVVKTTSSRGTVAPWIGS